MNKSSSSSSSSGSASGSGSGSCSNDNTNNISFKCFSEPLREKECIAAIPWLLRIRGSPAPFAGLLGGTFLNKM